MRRWMPSARWTRRTVALVLCGVVLVTSVTALALPRLIGQPARGATTASSASTAARASRDEQSEYRFARAHEQVPAATATATPVATPRAAPTSTSTPSVTTPATATATAAPAFPTPTASPAPSPAVSLTDTFAAASQASGVPVPLLEAICYMEGRLSNQGGAPSIDNGFGCMHLVHNDIADTLDRAASETGVPVSQLKLDIAANIRGGANILRDDALQLSSTHTLPATLSDWYSAVESYSVTSTPSVASMYADALYQILNTGFSVRAETGETITLAPQQVRPTRASAPSFTPHVSYPSGCSAPDANVDYPSAEDCILNPNVYDCEIASPGNSTNPCTYDQANRPNDLAISFVAIHDIEGTAQAALTTFQNVKSNVSIHYIVGADGTVYQVLHERDVAWHVGNYWYNQHAVGIEHEGYASTGYNWYSAAEYLASAKLTAYLLKKYNIPLDHNHIIAHGDVPSPTLATTPNHVDPGPYWMWSYYFNLINQQGVPFPPASHLVANFLALYPPSAAAPGSSGGAFPETSSGNYSYFNLYTGPSTKSSLIPRASTSDNTDETGVVGPATTYLYVGKQADAAGTGDTMYEVWYGEFDNLSSGNEFADARTAWIAVPPGDAVEGLNSVLTSPGAAPAVLGVTADAVVQLTGTNIYGKPATDASFITGGAPVGATFASAFTVTEDGTTNLWYEIDYNHRQAWVPASEAILTSVWQPR